MENNRGSDYTSYSIYAVHLSLIFLFCSLVYAVSPGEQINGFVNLTNATYPCYVVSSDTIAISADSPIGEVTCNITSMVYNGEETINYISSSGGGGSARHFTTIKKLVNTTYVDPLINQKKAKSNVMVVNNTIYVDRNITQTIYQPAGTTYVDRNITKIVEVDKNRTLLIRLILLCGTLIIIVLILGFILYLKREDDKSGIERERLRLQGRED